MLLGLLWWILVIVAGIVLITMGVVFKGAPYVPSRRSDVIRAFDELYNLGDDDVLLDIGSGDGSVLREAARRGARAIGVELNPFLVLYSRWITRRNPSVSVVWADMWRYRVPQEVTVIYVFGTGRDVPRIVQWVESQMASRVTSLYVISYGFTLPWVEGRTIGAHHMYEVAPLQEVKA